MIFNVLLEPQKQTVLQQGARQARCSCPKLLKAPACKEDLPLGGNVNSSHWLLQHEELKLPVPSPVEQVALAVQALASSSSSIPLQALTAASRLALLRTPLTTAIDATKQPAPLTPPRSVVLLAALQIVPRQLLLPTLALLLHSAWVQLLLLLQRLLLCLLLLLLLLLGLLLQLGLLLLAVHTQLTQELA